MKKAFAFSAQMLVTFIVATIWFSIMPMLLEEWSTAIETGKLKARDIESRKNCKVPS